MSKTLVQIMQDWTDGSFNVENLERFQTDAAIVETMVDLDRQATDEVEGKVVELPDRFDYLETFKDVAQPFDFSETLHYIWTGGWSNKLYDAGNCIQKNFSRVQENGWTVAVFDELLKLYLENTKYPRLYESGNEFVMALNFLPCAKELGISQTDYVSELKKYIIHNQLQPFLKDLNQRYEEFKELDPMVQLYQRADSLGLTVDQAKELIEGVELRVAQCRVAEYQRQKGELGWSYDEVRELFLSADDYGKVDSIYWIIMWLKQHYSDGMDKRFVLEKAQEFISKEDTNQYVHWIQAYHNFVEITDNDFATCVFRDGDPKHRTEELAAICRSDARETFLSYLLEERAARKAKEHPQSGEQVILAGPPQDGLYPSIVSLAEAGHELTVEHLGKLYALANGTGSTLLKRGSVKALETYLGVGKS